MTTVSSRRIKPKSCREARLRQTSTPQPVPQRRASAQLEENSSRQLPSKTRLFQTFSSLRLSLQSHCFQSIEFSSAYQDKTVVELLPQSSSSSIVGNERTWNVSGSSSSSGVGSLASAHSNRIRLCSLIWSDLICKICSLRVRRSRAGSATPRRTRPRSAQDFRSNLLKLQVTFSKSLPPDLTHSLAQLERHCLDRTRQLTAGVQGSLG